MKKLVSILFVFCLLLPSCSLKNSSDKFVGHWRGVKAQNWGYYVVDIEKVGDNFTVQKSEEGNPAKGGKYPASYNKEKDVLTVSQRMGFDIIYNPQTGNIFFNGSEYSKILGADGYKDASPSQITNASQNQFADVQGFYNAIKKAVLTKDINEVSNFLSFPFGCDFGVVTKEELLSGKSNIDINYFEILTKTNSLKKYTDSYYGIEDVFDARITKQLDGFWKLEGLYINVWSGD